jgi:hypothetical protein
MKVVQIGDVRRIPGLEHRSGAFFPHYGLPALVDLSDPVLSPAREAAE